MALLADQNLFPDQIVFNYIKWKETSLTFSQLFFFLIFLWTSCISEMEERYIGWIFDGKSLFFSGEKTFFSN